MSKLMFLFAAGAMGLIGYFYLLEHNEVAATRTAVTAAANETAMTLSKRTAPEPIVNADAGEVFKRALPDALKFENVTVRQSVDPVAPGRFRQSVKVFGRARTSMSELFNLDGAEIEVVATQDFDRAK